jgi:hypothetical protein
MSNPIDKDALAKAEERCAGRPGFLVVNGYNDSDVKNVLRGLFFYRALAAALNAECDALASRIAEAQRNAERNSIFGPKV